MEDSEQSFKQHLSDFKQSSLQRIDSREVRVNSAGLGCSNPAHSTEKAWLQERPLLGSWEITSAPLEYSA